MCYDAPVNHAAGDGNLLTTLETGLRDLSEDLATLSISSTYGIEIEYERGLDFSEPALSSALEQTHLFMDASKIEKRRFIDNGYWTHMSDDSVDGGELVSPIYSGTIPNALLEDICGALRASNAEVWTESPGVHVHVGVERLETLEAWQNLFGTLSRFQDMLYKIGSSPTRTKSGQHRSTGSAQQLPLVSHNSDWETLLVAHMKKSLAVTTFNVQSMNKGTIEFRLWDGTLDPTLLSFYIATSCLLVEKAADGSLRNFEAMSFDDLAHVLFEGHPHLRHMCDTFSEHVGYCPIPCG